MSMKLLSEGAVFGASTSIPIKCGISLDTTDYGILIIKTVSNAMAILPNSANIINNLSGLVNNTIIIFPLMGIIILLATLIDAFRKIQENLIVNLTLYVIGFIFGFFLIIIG
jgi:hypothetical protein